MPTERDQKLLRQIDFISKNQIKFFVDTSSGLETGPQSMIAYYGNTNNNIKSLLTI